MKLRVYEALEARPLRHIAVRPPMKHFAATDKIDPLSIERQVRYQLRAEFRAEAFAPEGETHFAVERAIQMVGREVFGELIYMLQDLEDVVLGEQWRPAHDPIMEQIDKMRRAMRGEDYRA